CRSLLTGSFFFQAEDGIRDFHVTGVQTCALPISAVSSGTGSSLGGWSVSRCRSSSAPTLLPAARSARSSFVSKASNALRSSWIRSEERRVGKECRSRSEQYHV